jgi:hypothetical protein
MSRRFFQSDVGVFSIPVSGGIFSLILTGSS